MIAFGMLRTTISFVGISNRSFISRVFYLIINPNIFSQCVTINKFCQSKHDYDSDKLIELLVVQ